MSIFKAASLALVLGLTLATAQTARAQAPAPQPEPEPAEAAAEPAPAARARPKPKPAPIPKSVSAVTVTNARRTSATALEVLAPGGEASVVAILSTAIPPGKSSKLSWKGQRGCLYGIRAEFADGAMVEADAVDLCKERGLVRLTGP